MVVMASSSAGAAPPLPFSSASNGCSIRLLKQVSSAVTACSTLSCVVALRLPCAGPITDSLR